MSEFDAEHQFYLNFDSAEEFERALDRNDQETGLFFPTKRAVSVGERVSILVKVKEVGSPVVLEGRIDWRRIRYGGPDMPAGMFVGLVDRDRARLDAIIRYLQTASRRKERRSHFRYPVFLPSSYRTAKGEFASETRNLSRHGTFLRCQGPLLSVGATFPVVLLLEGKDGRATLLSGRVAWIDYFEDTKGMGVEFVNEPTQLRKVNKLLDRIEKKLKKKSSK